MKPMLVSSTNFEYTFLNELDGIAMPPRAAKKQAKKYVLRGDRLKKFRDDYHMTQPEFEKFLGIGSGVVTAYENGSGDPSAEGLYKIAEKLGTSADYLLGLSDNPEVSPYSKSAQAAKPRNAREGRFLQKLRNGEFMELINELSSDALITPKHSGEDTPEQPA